MTKYVLNSGGVGNYPDKTRKYYEEILKGLGKNPKVLFCFFAGARENWEKRYEKYRADFLKYCEENKLSPEIELAFPDKFVEQMDRCDAVMIFGGDDHLLKYWVSQFELKKLFKDKVVAGSSAGASVLCDSFWTCDWRECLEGLGILKIKFIPHFSSTVYTENDPRGPIDWKKAYKELENYGDKTLPIYDLEEGDFVVLEK